MNQRSDDAEAYGSLLELAPEFLKEFVRRDGLAVDKYYREAFTRAGEVRSDRQTIPLVGSILGRQNLRKVTEVLAYGLRSATRPSVVLWLAPMVRCWGATRMLPELLRQLKAQLRTDPGGEPNVRMASVALITGRPEAHLEKAFDHVATSDVPRFPRALEILLIPRVMVAVAVHAPVGSRDGLPVPLGFISFDPRVIGRAGDYIASRSGPFLRDRQMVSLVVGELQEGLDEDAIRDVGITRPDEP